MHWGEHAVIAVAMDAILLIARGFHYELACQPGSNTYCAGGSGCAPDVAPFVEVAMVAAAAGAAATEPRTGSS
ncbi:MAG: hypothetical protein JSW48_11310 [Betaproteobacteria bacterium]|nr:MAG: hypothetical protein JSW48_11310 [Betaproteobacteria bacterium]